jgi:hypothetical protein
MTTLEETAELLRLFLIQRRMLSIENFGTIVWVRVPAVYQEATGTFSESSEQFQFFNDADETSPDLLYFLSGNWLVSEYEASKRLQIWVASIREVLSNDDTLTWTNVGTLSMQDDQIYLTIPHENKSVSDNEDSTSSTEVWGNEAIEDQENSPTDRRPAKIWMIITALVSMAMIVLHIYKHERLGVGKSGIEPLSKPPLQYQLKSPY